MACHERIFVFFQRRDRNEPKTNQKFNFMIFGIEIFFICIMMNHEFLIIAPMVANHLSISKHAEKQKRFSID